MFRKETNLKNIHQMHQIRLEPDMYGGTKANPNHMIQEALDNAIDQVLLGKADHVYVTLHSDGSASVLDNGEGMPVNAIKTVYGDTMPLARVAWTVPNSSSHYGQKAQTSAGKNGIGMKYTTATSDWFVGEIWRNGLYYKDEYEQNPTAGDHETVLRYLTPTNKKHELIGHKFKETPHNIEHGTRVRFLPDSTIYESIEFNKKQLKERLKQQAYIHAGIHLVFCDENTGEEITYYEPDGLRAYVEELRRTEIEKPFTTQIHEVHQRIHLDEDNFFEATVAFAYTNTDEKSIVSFVNAINTPDDGTHVTGFKNGLTKLLNDYNTKLGISKKRLEARDLHSGLVAVVSALHTKPQYTGQTKDKLDNADALTAMQTIMTKAGAMELDKAIIDVETILKQALQRANTREQFENLKNVNTKSKDAVMKVAKKLRPARKIGPKIAQDKDAIVSLYITEGDSPSGGAIRMRINDDKLKIYQAVLPLKGKIINAEKSQPKDVFANEEIQTIVATLGCGVGAECDPDKLNYNEVIIMTDADVDGAHIRLLLYTFFCKYMRPIVEAGYIHIAETPLFINTYKDGKHDFTYTEAEQKEYLKKHKPKEVQRLKGIGELSDALVAETAITPGYRRLKQVITPDFESDADLIRLFQGKDVSPRRRYIEEHAKFVNREFLN